MPPLELVAYVADKLGELRKEVVFLGGAVVGLLITDPAALSPRPTRDVDVVIELASRIAYYGLDERLRSMGFTNDMRGPVCRYLHGEIILDVMPTGPAVLGFSNRWYPLAVQTTQPHWLEGGAMINLITAPCFLGTKLEAFNDAYRENSGDIFMSRDFGDVVRVIDGRPAIVEEVTDAPDELRDFLKENLARICDENYLAEAIIEHVEQGREEIVIERIRSMAFN